MKKYNCPNCGKELTPSGDNKDHFICSGCHNVWVDIVPTNPEIRSRLK